MKNVTNPLLADSWADARLLVGGCAGCWAAGYCAAYAPTSLLPPVACPLAPTEAAPRDHRKAPTRD